MHHSQLQKIIKQHIIYSTTNSAGIVDLVSNKPEFRVTLDASGARNAESRNISHISDRVPSPFGSRATASRTKTTKHKGFKNEVTILKSSTEKLGT